MADVSQQGDNQHLADLKDAIQSRKLGAVIGVGVSRQVAKPLVIDEFEVVTWLGLIRHGIKRCLTLGAIDQKEVDSLMTTRLMRSTGIAPATGVMFVRKIDKPTSAPLSRARDCYRSFTALLA